MSKHTDVMPYALTYAGCRKPTLRERIINHLRRMVGLPQRWSAEYRFIHRSNRSTP